MNEDRGHIVEIYQRDMDRLRAWLERPNGSLSVGRRVTLEAVGGGGILIRTRPYRLGD